MNTPSTVLRALLATIDAGQAAVVASVVATNRSVPRHVGAKMLVPADGPPLGSVGGGEMETRVVAEARAMLAYGGDEVRTITYGLVDPARGDPGVCGGEVTISLELFMPSPTVYVVGCGHVGRAVVELAHWMGFRVVATDDRPEIEIPAVAEVAITGTIHDALARAPVTAETHLVVVTRNVTVDLEILPVLLASPARSIGVMGSRRRWETTRAELTARGVEGLDRVRTPIGIELQAETPEEIAVSIMAEIVALRRG